MSFRKDGIVVLLGAGASKEAGVPTSMDMINDIENLIINGRQLDGVDWATYRDLYFCVKSAILYGDGLKGTFGNRTNYNIEKLVNTLSELEKRESHPLYPFIGGWSIKILELAGPNFGNVKHLREAILDKLKAWVTIRIYARASYYAKLFAFKNEYNFPLRVFTLNYDLCIEKHHGTAILERGFDERTDLPAAENRTWDWRRFEDNENVPVDMYLYKMHGSIDWERDSEGNLTYSDEVTQIPVPDLIFGTNYKLQYVDPYLFFAYEFRRYTLDCQLILTIGYGFGDEHINGMLAQALSHDLRRRILCVIWAQDGTLEDRKKEIKDSLRIRNDDQVIVKCMMAKEFMEQSLTRNNLEQTIPEEENILQP